MVHSLKFIFTLAIFYFLTYTPFILGYIYKLDEYTIGTIYAIMSIVVGVLWFLGIEKLVNYIIKLY